MEAYFYSFQIFTDCNNLPISSGDGIYYSTLDPVDLIKVLKCDIIADIINGPNCPPYNRKLIEENNGRVHLLALNKL